MNRGIYRETLHILFCMISVFLFTNLIYSTDDGSESEADFSATTLSLAARNNPYVHQDAVHIQMLPFDVNPKKSYRYRTTR